MIGIAVLLAMLLFPGLVWLALRKWMRESPGLRLAGASLLPPLILVSAFALDAAVNQGKAEKAATSNAYILLFLFQLLMSMGVAGCCEAWLGGRRQA